MDIAHNYKYVEVILLKLKVSKDLEEEIITKMCTLVWILSVTRNKKIL